MIHHMITLSSRQCFRYVTYLSKRLLSIGQLKEKSLICLHGKSADEFLQGLITNDIKCISQPNSFVYSLFLNSKGRVLTDTFIYHTDRLSPGESNYIIEVDRAYAPELVKHLSRYNLRGKVKIDTSLQISPWIAMPTSYQLNNSKAWLPVNLFDLNDQRQLIFYASDPRGIPGWSGRILSKSDANVQNIFPSCDTAPLDLALYHQARWKLGLPEGVEEFITNDTLPFEANTDLSGGVSFSKGCYIGQELTARTHFTGVIRRRYVPVKIISIGNADVLKSPNILKDLYNAPIYQVNEDYQLIQSKLKPVGWIRGVNLLNIITTNTTNNNYDDIYMNIDQNHYPVSGIALIRLTEAGEQQQQYKLIVTPLSSPSSSLSSSTGNTDEIKLQIIPYIPAWWPEDIAPQIKRLVYT
ncbi:unnamed protein product [Trichobilharzia szidati]|nr:unnamed protein product [Trichobilharzia szidati]